MDMDGSGMVSIDEFCSWLARRNVVEPDEQATNVHGESLVLIYDEQTIEQLRNIVANPSGASPPAPH